MHTAFDSKNVRATETRFFEGIFSDFVDMIFTQIYMPLESECYVHVVLYANLKVDVEHVNAANLELFPISSLSFYALSLSFPRFFSAADLQVFSFLSTTFHSETYHC